MNARVRTALAVAVPAIVLALVASRFLPFIADDALISLRYADRLVDGAGLTWTDGERVEGYSNLLWILACAPFAWIGVDLITATRLLGAGCALLVFFAWARLLDAPRRIAPPMAASVALAASGPMAVWTIGGMEQPLCAALLACGLWRASPLLDPDRTSGRSPTRAAFETGAALALGCWARPDGPIFVAAFCAAVVWRLGLRRDGWLHAAQVALLPALAVASQLAFRLAYYDDWLPNTARVKARTSTAHLVAGASYLGDAFAVLLPLVALAGLGVVAAIAGRHRRGVASAAALCLGSWCAYVVVIGGDIFPAYRHAVVIAVLLSLLAGSGLEWIADRGTGARRAAIVVGLLSAPLLFALQLDDRHVERARNERWEWDGEVIGKVLRRGFEDRRPLLAVTAAGTLPYFSGLPALDLGGLNDRHIARQPAVEGHLGHDRGDGAYALDREPDLIAFESVGLGPPTKPSGRQMAGDPRFARDYVQRTFAGHDPYAVEARIWVRVDGRAGVERLPDGIRIPVHLFDDSPGQLDVEGEMIAMLRERRPTHSPVLDLPAGSWRVALEPPNPLVAVSVRRTGEGGFGSVAVAQGRLRIRGPVGDVQIALESPLDTQLRAVVVRRVGDGTGDGAVAVGERAVALQRAAIQIGPADREVSGPFTPARGDYLQLELRRAKRVGLRLQRTQGAGILMTWSRGGRSRIDLSPFAGVELALVPFDGDVEEDFPIDFGERALGRWVVRPSR